MTTPKIITARKVSNILAKAGIPVGYRYTQFGYETRDGLKIKVPGVEVTGMRRNSLMRRNEPADHISVFILVPDDATDRAIATEALRQRALEALLAADLAPRVKGDSTIVLDKEA